MIPPDIQTWTSQTEAEALEHCATDKLCLEIGAWKGFTTVVMARVAKHVFTVDTFEGDAHTGPAETLVEFSNNLEKYRVVGKVTPVVGKTWNTLPLLDQMVREKFDLVFVDGAHDLHSVGYDSQWAIQLCRPGGYIAWHDYGNPGAQVSEVVDALVEWEMVYVIEQVGLLLVAQRELTDPGDLDHN